MLNISQKAAKEILVAFYIVFAIFGVVLIVLGAIYKSNYLKHADESIPDAYSSIKYLWIPTIILGTIILVVALFGCATVFFLWTSAVLVTMASILLILFLLQIALGVYSLTTIIDRNQFDRLTNDTLLESFCGYKNEDSKKIVDYFQQKYKCCGLTGPSWWKQNRFPLPDTCYSAKSKEIFKEGCSAILSQSRSQFIFALSCTILVLILVPLFGTIVSFWMAADKSGDTGSVESV